MTTWIALFRGINVGGKNVLPMAALRSGLASLDLQNVRTYIQSGNAVFDGADDDAQTLKQRITSWIRSQYGYEPALQLLTPAQLQAAVDGNPYADATDKPNTLHLFFLATAAGDADTQALQSACADTEDFMLTDEVFYLHAPDGIGRSRLAANAERYLGVSVTARNLRTVTKLLQMVTTG
ncbi:MAG: DUF1697 domain-containing protein [Pseudomonadota bacterium]